MKQIKRALALLLCLVMLLTLAPLSAFAADLETAAEDSGYGASWDDWDDAPAEDPADEAVFEEPEVPDEPEVFEEPEVPEISEEPDVIEESELVAYPANEFYYFGGSGMRITVTAPEGAFPSDALMSVTELKPEDVQPLVDASAELSGKVLVAADISFSNAWGELQPMLPVQVSIVAPDTLTASAPVVVHFDDANRLEIVSELAENAAPSTPILKVENAADACTYRFEAYSFSKYAVVASESEAVTLPVPEHTSIDRRQAFVPGVYYGNAADLRGAGSDVDGLETTKRVTANSDGTYTVTLEQYTTGTVVTEHVPLDVVLILDRSSSLGNTGLSNVKTAAKSFIGNLAALARTTDTDTRLAIVSFSYNAVNVQGTLTDVDVNETALKSAVDGISNDAYYDILTRTDLAMSSAQSILSAQSSADRNRVVVLFTDGEPVEVNYVVNCGDNKYGPYEGDKYYSFYDQINHTYPVTFDTIYDWAAASSAACNNPANRALATAKAMKDAGIIIYAVGIFDGADGSSAFVNDPNAMYAPFTTYTNEYTSGAYTYKEEYTDIDWSEGRGAVYNNKWMYVVKSTFNFWYKYRSGNWVPFPIVNPYYEPSQSWESPVVSQLGNKFLHLLSSNYPSASSMSSYTYSEWSGGSSYYLSGVSTADLSSLFSQITTSLSPAISLSSTAAVKDTITAPFEMVPNAAVSVYTQDYQGNNAWGSRTAYTGATVSAANNTVTVTSFDYDANFVSETDKGGGDYGRKLIIEFTIRPVGSFLGGNAVPTNGDDSGVYTSTTETYPIETFDVPEVNVPLSALTVTAEDKVVYLTGDVAQADMLENAIVSYVDRYDPNTKYDVSSQLVNGVYTADYATITLTPSAAQTGVTAGSTYTLTAVATSINEPAVGDDAGPGGDPGSPTTDVTVSSTGSISVITPLLLFRDQFVWIGMSFADVNYDSYDYIATAWMYGDYAVKEDGQLIDPTLSGQPLIDPDSGNAIYVDPINVRPDLTLSYTPAAAANTYVNTAEDIPVKVTVSIDSTDVSGYCVFEHVGVALNYPCAWSSSYSGGDPAFLLHVISAQLTINKWDDDGDTPLSGAQFEALRWNGTSYAAYDGNTFTIDETGAVTLPAGNYKLTEQAAPTGYAVLEEPIYVKIRPCSRFVQGSGHLMRRLLYLGLPLDFCRAIDDLPEPDDVMLGFSVEHPWENPRTGQGFWAHQHDFWAYIRLVDDNGEILPIDNSSVQDMGFAKLRGGYDLTVIISYEYVDGELFSNVTSRVTGSQTLDVYNQPGYFFVYHSNDCSVEKILMTDGRINADGEFDITAEVAENYLYGGYYNDYNRKSSGFSAADLEYTETDGKLMSSDSTGTYYTGGIGSWIRNNAYTATLVNEVEGGPGTAMKPVMYATYYLKEVPAAYYLRPYLYVVYNQTFDDQVVGLYIMTDVDDANYSGMGMVAENLTTGARIKLAAKYTVTTKYSSDSITAATVGGAGTKGYVAVWQIASVPAASSEFVYTPAFVTPDGITVEGNAIRTVNTGDGTYDRTNGFSSETGYHFTDAANIADNVTLPGYLSKREISS